MAAPPPIHHDRRIKVTGFIAAGSSLAFGASAVIYVYLNGQIDNIIKAASVNKWGVISLVFLILGSLAWSFFNRERVGFRLLAFLMIFLGGVGFGFAVLVQPDNPRVIPQLQPPQNPAIVNDHDSARFRSIPDTSVKKNSAGNPGSDSTLIKIDTLSERLDSEIKVSNSGISSKDIAIYSVLVRPRPESVKDIVRVYVDGDLKRTGWGSMELSGGDHRLRLEAEGYESCETDFRLPEVDIVGCDLQKK